MSAMLPISSLRWTAEDSALPAGWVRYGHTTKAEWSWLTAGRVTVLLCGPCRDEWQREADADPSLKPVSVTPAAAPEPEPGQGKDGHATV